jgi:hypothetical protein
MFAKVWVLFVPIAVRMLPIISSIPPGPHAYNGLVTIGQPLSPQAPVVTLAGWRRDHWQIIGRLV